MFLLFEQNKQVVRFCVKRKTGGASCVTQPTPLSPCMNVVIVLNLIYLISL